MIYLFVLVSFYSSLLFFLPISLHKPFHAGLFLFLVLISGYTYFRSKKDKQGLVLDFFYSIDRQILSSSKGNIKSVFIFTLICYILSFSWHYYQLCLAFANSLSFHDADYVGMQEVIRSLGRRDFYLSRYYSNSGEGSYLSHHFAPALVLFLPFEYIMPDRWGYAIGILFYYLFGILLWASILWKKFNAQFLTINDDSHYKKLSMDVENKSQNYIHQIPIFFLIIFCLFNSVYLYRLGTSFHFEVLVIPLSALFFASYERWKHDKTKKRLTSVILSLTFFLMIKEDISIYLMLFLIPFICKESFDLSKQKIFYKIKFQFSKFYTSPVTLIFIFCLLYSSFTMFVLPYFFHPTDRMTWIGALTQNYGEEYKKVTGFSKTIRIFFELMISAGFGFVSNVNIFIGLTSIYLTHVFSERPWHHEVYSYYCYTIVPFLLYSSYLWIKEKKNIPHWMALVILALVVWKNSQDTNYPLNPTQVQNRMMVNSGIQTKGNLKNQIKEELDEQMQTLVVSKDAYLFSQYNLSFFLPKENALLPLSKLELQDKLCQKKECYLILAPKLTFDILVTEKKLKTISENIHNGNKLYQGEMIEIWKLN